MASATEIIENCFAVLRARPGFVDRPDQQQLAMLLSDLIEGKSNGAFEAPTGLGKSLAALIPALAQAIANERRTVVATYTNVLAEQYWFHDVPLALELLAELELPKPKVKLLMGRAKYTCLVALEEQAPHLREDYHARATLGIESEFRRLIPLSPRESSFLWSKTTVPPVCPGRTCPLYDDCYYYKARREATEASLVITNHSVVIQDAVMSRNSEDGGSLLGSYDFLILDEAHDFPQAATNGLEFEISPGKLSSLMGIATRLESSLLTMAQRFGDGAKWQVAFAKFRAQIEAAQRSLVNFGLGQSGGILTASPPELMEHPQVKAAKLTHNLETAEAIANSVASATDQLTRATQTFITEWREADPERTKSILETTRNYTQYLREYAIGCVSIFGPSGVEVSYSSRSGNDPILRRDIVGLAEPLRELIWDRVAYACLSATLAIDGSFDFFLRTTGAQPGFQEVLPTPFDYASQAAIYLPPADSVPDPTIARKQGSEGHYYQCLAREIQRIIEVCDGRTLVLFHSRKEMEAVHAVISLPDSLPVYTQTKSGVAAAGQRFLKEKHSSLFALRSFWTGFDAPGETLSCVVLVRVPFEVPIDPPQIARLAYLQQQGLDAFAEHTLPMAKMMMRQGAGRLIRRAEDRGVIALLDTRLQSKLYGEQIIENLPREMRTFREIEEAAAWIGLESRAD